MMKSSGSSWGNKFGMIHLPIHCHKSGGTDPLESLQRNKVMLDRKKNLWRLISQTKLHYDLLFVFGKFL